LLPSDGDHNIEHRPTCASSVLLDFCRKETIGKCTLYLADCQQILPTLERVPAVVTDPPYGIGRTSGGVGKSGVLKWGGPLDLKWDKQPSPALLEAVVKAADHHIIWGGNYLPLGPARCFLVWDKGACFRNRKFAEAELAWTSLRLNTKVFARDPIARRDYKGKVHPTQKPLPLMLWCLELLPQGCHTILDPFMGAGSTGVACVMLKRRFIGIEREPRFFELACSRIAAAIERPTLSTAG
jgi:DNA modification methylase